MIEDSSSRSGSGAGTQSLCGRTALARFGKESVSIRTRFSSCWPMLTTGGMSAWGDLSHRLLEGWLKRAERWRWLTLGCSSLRTYADDEALFASIMAGASGYMLKTATPMELIHAVRRVAQGESPLAPAVTQRVLARVRQSPLFARDEKLARLTPREDEVLKLLATGKTNAQIAREIHISEKTVKNHVSTVLGKLEVARRTEAAAYFAMHSNPFG